MQTILIINSKGGCGKTTITTNIASYFATKGRKTAIMDYDPQGSSMQWLKQRSPGANRIHGANAAPQKGSRMRALQMHVAHGTEFLIIDAPAGVDGLLLQEIVRRTNHIIIPVAPSAIDIHATADFVKDLLLVGRIRARNVKVAVVANRVRSSMPVYEPLERFLNALKLPFLTRISDSDNYITAAEIGLGVFEMESYDTHAEQREFQPIIEWLGAADGMQAQSDNKVVGIATRRLALV